MGYDFQERGRRPRTGRKQGVILTDAACIPSPIATALRWRAAVKCDGSIDDVRPANIGSRAPFARLAMDVAAVRVLADVFPPAFTRAIKAFYDHAASARAALQCAAPAGTDARCGGRHMV
jgi:hypothetical protein